MIDKLEAIINTFDDLSKSLSDPEVISNSKKFAKIAKEHNSLTEIVEKAKEYISKTKQLSSANDMLDGDDEELVELAKDTVVLALCSTYIKLPLLKSIVVAADVNPIYC